MKRHPYRHTVGITDKKKIRDKRLKTGSQEVFLSASALEQLRFIRTDPYGDYRKVNKDILDALLMHSFSSLTTKEQRYVRKQFGNFFLTETLCASCYNSHIGVQDEVLPKAYRCPSCCS